MAKECVKKN